MAEVERTGPRGFFVLGNWKENHTVAPLVDLILDVINPSVIDPCQLQVVIAPAMIHIPKSMELLRRDIQIAAQTCSPYGFGAYTGEVSTEMLKDLGVKWVIAGHSERRTIFNETDEIVAMKVKRILAVGLKAVICLGESLQHREEGKALATVISQLEALRSSFTNWKDIVLTYEPLWAVGTGRTASPDQAQEMHSAIRNWVLDNYGQDVASKLQIIYAGSVNSLNCRELMLERDIDGLLIGGASLRPEFRDIVETCNKTYLEKYGGN